MILKKNRYSIIHKKIINITKIKLSSESLLMIDYMVGRTLSLIEVYQR